MARLLGLTWAGLLAIHAAVLSLPFWLLQPSSETPRGTLFIGLLLPLSLTLLATLLAGAWALRIAGRPGLGLLLVLAGPPAGGAAALTILGLD